MKRKVNRVGQNTLTVSIPSKWAKSNGVEPGNELEVLEEKNTLVIRLGSARKKTLRAKVNIDDFNLFMLRRFIAEFYRHGSDQLVIEFSEGKISDYNTEKKLSTVTEVKKITSRYIGLEMIYHSDKKIILESLIETENLEKIDMVERRVFLLLKELLSEFSKSMESDFAGFQTRLADCQETIVKLAYYYLRLLNKSDEDYYKKTRLNELIFITEKMVNKIRHTGEVLASLKKISPKIKKYVSQIFNLFEGQFDFVMYPKKEQTAFDALLERRYALVKSIRDERFTEDELRVLAECKILLDTTNDFYEAYLALNMQNYAAPDSSAQKITQSSS